MYNNIFLLAAIWKAPLEILMLLEAVLPIAVYCIFLFNIKIQKNYKGIPTKAINLITTSRVGYWSDATFLQ